MGVELPPRLCLPANIKDPARMTQMIEIPSADSDENVKDTRDKEKVGGKDELMVEEMRNDAEQDGERERDEPKCNGVDRLEK